MVSWRRGRGATFHLCSVTYPDELLWIIRERPKVQVLQGGSRYCFWLAWEQDAAVLLACTCARPCARAHIDPPFLRSCAVRFIQLILQPLAVTTEVAWRCRSEHEGCHLEGVQGLCVLSSICGGRARSCNVSVVNCESLMRCLGLQGRLECSARACAPVSKTDTRKSAQRSFCHTQAVSQVPICCTRARCVCLSAAGSSRVSARTRNGYRVCKAG